MIANRALRRATEASNRRALQSGKGWGEWSTASAEELLRSASRHAIAATCTRAWRNRRFVVLLYPIDTAWGLVLHLHVRVVDTGNAPRWAELQRVKAELLGPERLAIEVYPPAEQLVDDADAYHLWVFPAGFEMPFGLHRGGYGT